MSGRLFTPIVAEQRDERQIQDRADGGPEVAGRSEGLVPVRGGEAVAWQDQSPGERGARDAHG